MPRGDAADARPAAVLMGAQAAVLLVMAVLLALTAVSGDASDVTRAWTESALVLVFSGLVAVCAVGIWRGRGVARTPSILWNALLLPVAFSMISGGSWAIGGLVLLVAVTTIVLTLRLPRVDAEETF